MGKTVWVQNLHTADLRFQALAGQTVINDLGREVNSAAVVFEQVFRVRKDDAVTGQTLHTGFTEIEVEKYDLLIKHNAQFRTFVEAKKLVEFDEAPPEARTGPERLNVLQLENAELRAEIDRLTKKLKKRAAKNEPGKEAGGEPGGPEGEDAA
jgi:hypothetical protein